MSDPLKDEHVSKIMAGIKFYRMFIKDRKYDSAMFAASWPRFLTLVENYIKGNYGMYPEVKKNPEDSPTMPQESSNPESKD